MNHQQLHQNIIAAARKLPAEESVPYAFEKRVMRRILTRPEADIFTLWGRMMWRAAFSCLVVMAATGAWNSFNSLNLSQSESEFGDLEYAVLEPVHTALEESW